MKRSTALLRLAAAFLIFGAVVSGLVPGLTTPAQADPTTCTTCFHAGFCQPCEDGGVRLCLTEDCCGVTTVISCGICSLRHCVPPPA